MSICKPRVLGKHLKDTIIQYPTPKIIILLLIIIITTTSMDFDPYQRHSFWLCITLGFFFAMGSYGVNQSQTQRYFSTKTIQEAQR